MAADDAIDAGDFFLEDDIGSALFGKFLVIRVLELLERAHHFGVRHHGLGGNALLGFKPGFGIDIHSFLLCYGHVLPRAGHGAAQLRVPRCGEILSRAAKDAADHKIVGGPAWNAAPSRRVSWLALFMTQVKR